MPEYGLNLWDYWRIVYKRKWIIVSIFLISIVSVHFLGEKRIPIYKSTVTLHLSTGRTPIAEITGSGVTFWGGSTQNVSTQLALIKSYSILRKVALSLGYVKEDDPEDVVMPDVLALRGKIAVAEKESSELVDITVRDTDRFRAKQIAEAVAVVFIDVNWEKKVQEARNTKTFVEEQLRKMDKTIASTKRKLNFLGADTQFQQLLKQSNTPQAFSDDSTSTINRLADLKLQLALLKNKYTDNHPTVKKLINEIAVASKEQALKSVEEKLTPEKRRKSARDAAEEEELSKAQEEGYLDVERLENELAINQKLYVLLMERYEKARILEASKPRDIEIVNPATLPPLSNVGRKTANVFLGGAIGLVLGLLAAFVTESLDTSIGTIEDVEEYLRMPVLGVIPRIEQSKKEDIGNYLKKTPPPEERHRYESLLGRVILQLKPKSSVTEAYRNLQTYIKFTGLDKMGNALMFTSAGIREGKTITSVNSAISMAQLGYKVVIVDTDLRRPSVHRVFGIEREMGVTETVLGTFKLDDVIKTMDDVMMGNIKSSFILETYGMENLSIITAGHLPSNPTEILSSENMTNFIEELKKRFQVVLFDTAPILPVTDSCILSSKVDGVILVYEVGRVARGALKRSKMQIENAKGKPIGVVLNSMRASDMKFGSSFYYYANKYYGEEHEHAERSKKSFPFFRRNT